MKMKLKNYAELLALVQALNATNAERGTKREEKLKKIAKKVKPIFDDYNDEKETIRLDNAYTDAYGVLVLNEKGEYKYTKEGAKKMKEDMKKLLNKEFDFYRFTFSSEGIEDLLFLDGWVESMTSKSDEKDF
jgi:hypothetical protein